MKKKKKKFYKSISTTTLSQGRLKYNANERVISYTPKLQNFSHMTGCSSETHPAYEGGPTSQQGDTVATFEMNDSSNLMLLGRVAKSWRDSVVIFFMSTVKQPELQDFILSFISFLYLIICFFYLILSFINIFILTVFFQVPPKSQIC